MKKILSLLVAAGAVAGCSQLKDMGLADIGGGVGQIANIPGAGIAKGTDISLAAGAGLDLVKAATVSDSELAASAAQAIKHSDSTAKVAPANSPYTKRLARLLANHQSEDGLKLSFKVYLDDSINAFAMPNGDIRVMSGLLDKMDDGEVLAIIGHEIGHVKLGHSGEKMRMKMLSSAARKGVASQYNVAGDLMASQLGGMLEDIVNKQFSQSEETEADEYGLDFLLKHNYEGNAAASAFRKMAAEGSSSGGLFSTHPAALERAEHLEALLKEKGGTVMAKASTSEKKTSTVQVAKHDDHPTSAMAIAKASAIEHKMAVKSAVKPIVAAVHMAPAGQVTQQWAIQLSAETDLDIALQKSSLLKSNRYPSMVESVEVDGQKYHRVLVGPFRDRPMQQFDELYQRDFLSINQGEPFVKRVG